MEQIVIQQQLKRREEARDDGDSWREWYCLTPLERWHESMKLWEFYLRVGGSLDPEPDHQSPFHAFLPRGSAPAYGRSAVQQELTKEELAERKADEAYWRPLKQELEKLSFNRSEGLHQNKFDNDSSQGSGSPLI